MTDADVTMLQLSPLTQTSGSTPNQSPEFHENSSDIWNMSGGLTAGYRTLREARQVSFQAGVRVTVLCQPCCDTDTLTMQASAGL